MCKDITLPDSAKDFLAYCKTEKGLSEGTVKNYKQDIQELLAFINKSKKQKINDSFVKKIKIADLRKFTYYLEEQKNIKSTRRRKISSIKSYFEYLEDEIGMIKDNPSRKLKTPKPPKRQPIYLTLEESTQLIQSIEKSCSSKNFERDYCIIVLFLNTAMRISELENMTINNIKGDVLTIIGKGDKERSVYLNDLSLKVINQYLSVRDKYEIQGNKFFNIKMNEIRKLVKNYILKAGIDNAKKYSPHKLRHTSATLMYKYGKTDIRSLQEILGHENIATTAIYTHVDNEDLRKAVNNNPLNDLI
jgi:site-specific recombinase XerD